MKCEEQMSFAASGFDRFARSTKRASFLSEMGRIVPWERLCAVLGDPAVEEALYGAFWDEGAYRHGQQAQDRPFVRGHAGQCSDSRLLPDLLHGDESRVWGDAAYRGQTAAIRFRAPGAADFTHHYSARRKGPSKRQQEAHRAKARVRARVEHAFHVIKRIFGFMKVRYRGITKNAHRLVVNYALANLYLHRRGLLSGAFGVSLESGAERPGIE